jgi:hypothetical protein
VFLPQCDRPSFTHIDKKKKKGNKEKLDNTTNMTGNTSSTPGGLAAVGRAITDYSVAGLKSVKTVFSVCLV